MDVFHHAPPIHGIQNTEIQKKFFVTLLLLYSIRLIYYKHCLLEIVQTVKFLVNVNETILYISIVNENLLFILQDALTDAVAEAERIEVEGQEIYAHKGILQSARYIKRTLEDNQILEKAFQKVPVSIIFSILKAIEEKKEACLRNLHL